MSDGNASPPGEPIALQTLRGWIQSDDPLLHNLAFHTAYAHPETVNGLNEEERLKISLRFLEHALAGRYGDSIPDGPYVTAHTVLDWLSRLTESEDPSNRTALTAILAMLERLARSSDDATRDVIVLGVLEHAFEHPRLRALFEQWADDPHLAPLYKEAVRLSS
jgi:hypothetical protein